MIGKFWSTFVILILAWLALAGIAYQEILAGIAVALVISTMVSVRILPKKVARITPKGLALLLFFIPKFIIYEISSHLMLLKIIYSPKPKIDPDIIEIPLKLKKKLQITSVATAVTMLPGTLTLDYNGKLIIHTINKNDGPVEFTHRLEKELGRAFS